MRCTPTIHDLIVLTLPPRHRCPLDRMPASRLLLPRSGLERSDFVHWHFSDLTAFAYVCFAPTMAIKHECFYVHDASLLTAQSKSTNHNPWQGQGNLIAMQPCNGRCPFSGERVMLQLLRTICCVQ